MDGKKKAIIIVAVVVVLIAAVFAAQALNDKHEDSRDTDVTFLIQDNMGVYFWIDGNGETVYDAFVDAAEKYAIPFVPSESSYGKGIQSLYGLEMTQVSDSEWIYWQQYSYQDGAWVLNEVTMEKIDSSDVDYVAVVYGGYGVQIAVSDVSKAKVWDFSTDGTVFTVQSPSGLYYRVNGEGTTVIDAWKDAMSTYSIPCTTSAKDGADYGIKEMYGLEMTSEAPYSWWTQFVIENGEWVQATSYMSGINTVDCKQMLISYAFEGVTFDPKAPAY